MCVERHKKKAIGAQHNRVWATLQNIRQNRRRPPPTGCKLIRALRQTKILPAPPPLRVIDIDRRCCCAAGDTFVDYVKKKRTIQSVPIRIVLRALLIGNSVELVAQRQRVRWHIWQVCNVFLVLYPFNHPPHHTHTQKHFYQKAKIFMKK